MDFFDSDKLRETFWIVNARLWKHFSTWGYQLGWSRDTIQDWIEQVTADGIMSARENFHDWDKDRGCFHTWVTLRAKHIGRKRLLKENRGASLVADLIVLEPPTIFDPIKESLDNTELALVLRAIHPAQCEALSLHYLWGLEVKRVARIMDCPIKTIYTLLDRGRKNALAEFEKIRRAELKLENKHRPQVLHVLSQTKDKGREETRPPPSEEETFIGKVTPQ